MWQELISKLHFMVLASAAPKCLQPWEYIWRTSCHHYLRAFGTLSPTLFSVSLLFPLQKNTCPLPGKPFPDPTSFRFIFTNTWGKCSSPARLLPARPHLALTELSGDRYFLWSDLPLLARPQTKQLISRSHGSSTCLIQKIYWKCQTTQLLS